MNRRECDGPCACGPVRVRAKAQGRSGGDEVERIGSSHAGSNVIIYLLHWKL